MGKNQKSVDGVIEKLALITDGIQTLFPNGKSFIVFELNYYQFDFHYKIIAFNFLKTFYIYIYF